jgi:hypothetical protein
MANVTTKRIQGVPIQIEEVKENTIEEKGTYYSQWHLLVNSNVSANNDLEKANRIADVLKDSIRCVFYEHGEEIFKFKDPEGKDKFEKPTVESVNVKMAAEIGDIQHRVHVHALITVVHHTILQIDYPKAMRAMADCIHERDPTLRFPFMRFKQIPMTGVALEKYIGKHPVMT